MDASIYFEFLLCIVLQGWQKDLCGYLQNFKVKCFRLRCKLNGIGKYVFPCPRSSNVELEIVFKTQLEESSSWPISYDVLAFDATVESTADGGVLIGLGTKKSQRRSLRLAFATTVAEEIGDFNEQKGALPKRIWTTMSNATRRWQEVWSAKFTWAEGEFDSFGNLTAWSAQSAQR